MGDVFGALDLPALVGDEDHAGGDPLLDAVGAFLTAVMRAKLEDLWKRIDPNKARPSICNGPGGRGYFPHNPQRHRLIETMLPALFVFRKTDQKVSTIAQEHPQHATRIAVQWVYHRGADQKKSSLREPFANAVGKAISDAIFEGRDSSWVLDSDLAIPDALVLAQATSTSPVTLSGAGLTGALATTPWPKGLARAVTISTDPAPSGTYATGSDIVVTGTNDRGAPWVTKVRLTQSAGNETVSTIWLYKGTTSIALPAMLSGAGRIRVGYGPSTVVSLGSILRTAAGCSRLDVDTISPAKVLPIQVVKDLEKGTTDVLVLEMVETILVAEELRTRDPAVHYDQLGTGGGDLASTGADVEIDAADGSALQNASF